MAEDVSEWIQLILDTNNISIEDREEWENHFKNISEEELTDLLVSVEADRDDCMVSAQQLSDSVTKSVKFDTVYKAYMWTADKLINAIKERDLDRLVSAYLLFDQIQQKMTNLLKEIEITSKDY